MVTAAPSWEAVKRWVSSGGHTLDTSTATRLPGGLANENYLVRFDTQCAVFRCPPPGQLAEGAGNIVREGKVLSGIHPSFPLAPRPYLICDDEAVIGRPFMLLEYRSGVGLGGRLPEGLGSDAPSLLASLLAGTLAKLHVVDPDATPLGSLGRPNGFLRRQLDGWTRRAQAVWPESMPPAVLRLHDGLARTIPDPQAPRLLHMDFKLDNLLVDPATFEPTALIDWEMATRGCPIFDLAILLSYWVEPDDPTDLHQLNQVPSLAPGAPTRHEIVDEYFKARAIAPVAIDWYLACARLRLAVAWMQLYRLWERGQVVGDSYSHFEAVAHAVLDFADSQLQEAQQ